MSANRLAVDLTVRFPDFTLAVERTFTLGGITALFGPSGSGKSTLLRAIAGFERTGIGRIALDEEAWLDSTARLFVPAHRRPVGFMFQDARLFPHLDVAGNLRFAALRAGDAPRVTFDDVVAALDLAPLLSRRTSTLSGGERQRVALGRTLLTAPRLLLLDEPLSALDAKRKGDILPYLADVPRRFGIPALYVTHSIDEVARLADTMAILEAGRLTATGATADMLERLDLAALAGPFDAGVVVAATVTGYDAHYRLAEVRLAGQPVTLPAASPLPADRTVRLRILARDVAVSRTRPEGLSIRNALSGTLAERADAPHSALTDLVIDLGGARLRARVTRAAADDLALTPGAAVFALVKSATFDTPMDGAA